MKYINALYVQGGTMVQCINTDTNEYQLLSEVEFMQYYRNNEATFLSYLR